MRDKDHWDCLNELAEELITVSAQVQHISEGFDGIADTRRQFAPTLVRVFCLCQILKMKLSVMPNEWNKTIDEVVEKMIKENKKEESFDTMDF